MVRNKTVRGRGVNHVAFARRKPIEKKKPKSVGRKRPQRAFLQEEGAHKTDRRRARKGEG